MEQYKREFIQFLEGAGVLKFGDFTAKSGRKIPYFINAGMIKTGNDIAKLGEFYAKAYTEKGALVPDEVVIGIIKDHLSSESCKNGFILDGFPRSIPQAEALDAMGVKIDAVVTFEVPDEVIVDRMSKRRMCPDCGASYHLDFKPSKDNKTCDKCGAELYTRKDDAPETVLARLQNYHTQTEPLEEFYEKKGILKRINGVGAVDEISKMTLDALSQL